MQSCLYRKLFCYFVNRNNRITASLYHAKERSIDEYKEDGQRVENLHNTFLNYLQVNIMSKSNLKKYMMSLNIKTPERESFIASELRKNQLTPLDDIKQSPNNTSVTQTASKLLPILIIIDILDKEPNNAQFLFLLKRVDETCSRMLCDLSFDETLILLNELARTAPTKVMLLGFYLESIKTLRLRLSENKQSSLQIMNLLFLMSLRKTEALLDVRYTLKYLSDFEKLSIIEQCIVSIAAFKCGVKLDRQIIHIIEGTVQRNVEKLLKNQKLFVPLLKAMRHAGPSREFSLDHLSKRILEHKEKYKMSLAVPILALYAEILQADSKVINRLVGDAFLQMRKSGSILEDNIAAEDAIRVKDIDRLLWAVSTLNHKLTHSQLLYVEKFLSDNLDAFSRYPKAFCGSLLALWILGSKCRQACFMDDYIFKFDATILLQIIEYCFRVKIFHRLLQNSSEDSGRLVVLLACIKIEAPTVVIPSNLIWDTNKEPLLNEYSELECISSILKCLESQLKLSEINVDCPVNEIRIYGISAKHETLGWLHVDLLNNYTCLCKPRKPHGLMNLKLRLIKTLGYTSILVDNIGPLKVEKVVTTIGEAIDELMRK